MKVLGISAGSKNGNNDAMCKEALMGAREAGADEIQFINLNDLHLEHCTGCTACVMSLMSGKGGACIIKDDFEWLRDKMMDADAIVWSVPIFEKGASGLFRTITDRMGPRNDKAMIIVGSKIAEETGGKLPDQRMLKDKVVAYIGVGGSDWSTRIQCDFFNQALTPAWKVIDTEVFSWSKCIVMDEDKVNRSHQIGVELANAAKDYEAAKWVGDPGICPHCHCRNFYLSDDATKATCCACGLVGEVKVDGGKVSFHFDPETEARAHDLLSGKFMHVDDIKENEGKLMELKKTDEFKRKKQAYIDFISATKPD
ncbi:flavodoxin family protein [Aminicella lysinilytica]|uniref:NADPH-dependent FMN reductase n=1 Tax=Aminicella lysinilytica TaxID=433323 RepID=A0A4R6QDJ6_9FIRM|nr:NAD(P)H-dependent oxidoreductase [Aminicella lysinilytica]TDP60531.1 NADPH-dependent FMN reductase [Aminicella lysinilytica]